LEKLKHKGKKPPLELLNEKILKNYFYKVKRENCFSPNLQEKPLSAYTEYARNDRSFSNIGPIKKKFPV
jgi:hypothetical protein